MATINSSAAISPEVIILRKISASIKENNIEQFISYVENNPTIE